MRAISFHIVLLSLSLYLHTVQSRPTKSTTQSLQPDIAKVQPLSRRRSGRRNDRLFNFFKEPQPQQSLFSAGASSPQLFKKTHATTVHKKKTKPSTASSTSFTTTPQLQRNSPITYIKMPAVPYSYVKGQGYVSQPASPFMPLMNFFSSASSNLFSGRTEPAEENRSSSGGSSKRRKDTASSGSSANNLLNFDFLSSIAKVHRPKISYISNARPFNVYKWPLDMIVTSPPRTTTTSTTTTTTTTTATTTTTTTTTSTPTTSTNSRKDGEKKKPENSPVYWIGKFIFNGLPHTVSQYKSPFSPLYWYDSLKDIKYPSTKLFNTIFKRR